MPKFSMADSRVFTDYRENCRTNESLQSQANMDNTRMYRSYLQHNAKELIDNQRSMAQVNHKNGCMCSGCSRIHKQ